ncbi:hypothetical protein X564_11475 [Pseudoalteromonas agarivorans]|nr:hypothetical protein X564_11475 [Pseudoalteromonas agarivorans]
MREQASRLQRALTAELNDPCRRAACWRFKSNAFTLVLTPLI